MQGVPEAALRRRGGPKRLSSTPTVPADRRRQSGLLIVDRLAKDPELSVDHVAVEPADHCPARHELHHPRDMIRSGLRLHVTGQTQSGSALNQACTMSARPRRRGGSGLG